MQNARKTVANLNIAVVSAAVDNAARRSVEGGVALNIMPTGASITFGINSSDGNGYRSDLRDMFSCNQVNYIGTQHGGTMSGNACEGYPGKRIGQIQTLITNNSILSHKPNVILINAGTNVSKSCIDYVLLYLMLTTSTGLRAELESFHDARTSVAVPRLHQI